MPTTAIDDPDATVIRREGHRVCLAFDPQRVSPAELIRRVTERARDPRSVRREPADRDDHRAALRTVAHRREMSRTSRRDRARLRPYLAIVGARFRMLLQYRAAAIGGMWTQIFFGLVLIMVYEAFYRSTHRAAADDVPQIVSYVWLGQALLAMLPWNADAEVRAMVRSGAVAYELCRPVDLYSLWYARALALRTAPTVLRAVPMCVVRHGRLAADRPRRVAARAAAPLARLPRSCAAIVCRCCSAARSRRSSTSACCGRQRRRRRAR